MRSDSLQFIEVYALSQDWASYLPAGQKLHVLKELEDLSNTLFSESYSLLILDEKTTSADFQKFVQALNPTLLRRLKVIYVGKDLTEEVLITLANLPAVAKILDRRKDETLLATVINETLLSFTDLVESDDLLDRVRAQNKMLNELNENLEKIVDQRTEHLEVSKREIEQKIKDLREQIRFIKSLSNIDGFEDLILILKQEFIKHHKVRAPMMVYSLSPNSYRCVYFQGPQIVDQIINGEEIRSFKQDPVKLREILANTLERPVSPVICLFLDHPDHHGTLVFEHNLDAEEQKSFSQLLEVRRESLKVAFDRLALKWTAHQISKQWSTTFDSLEDPIVIIDQNYQVIRFNKEFAQFANKSCHRMFADRDKICVGCPVKDSISQFEAHTGKVSRGSKIYEVHSYPIVLNHKDRTFNMIVHYTDVTKSMKLQGQIIQNEKMSAIGLLAGNIAHELNNPLTGIKSLAQILLTEIDPTSIVRQDLTEIKNAAERSEQIIKNLLEFSSIQGPVEEIVSIRKIVEKTLPFLKTTLRHQNSRIELSEGDDLVRGDSHLLQQVIFNLVNNACQAMGDTGDLTIRSTIHSESIEVAVGDTGPGVPEGIREAIFTPFFTTKEEGKGTGLGLSMSRAIIEKMGGTLSLGERSGSGSEFIITLPRVEP